MSDVVCGIIDIGSIVGDERVMVIVDDMVKEFNDRCDEVLEIVRELRRE